MIIETHVKGMISTTFIFQFLLNLTHPDDNIHKDDYGLSLVLIPSVFTMNVILSIAMELFFGAAAFLVQRLRDNWT